MPVLNFKEVEKDWFMMNIKEYLVDKRKRTDKIDTYFVSYILVLVVVRAFLAVTAGYAIMCSDEVCHWGLSRSIFESGQTFIRGIPVDIFSCLYSISIGWVHLFSDYEMQYTIAYIANAVYMVSMLIPFYLLAQKVLNNKTKAFLITVVAGLLPEFAYNTHILQENLFFTLVMWTFYFIYRSYEKEELHVKDTIIIGILACVCFWTRRAGICIAMAVIGSLFWNMTYEKKLKQYLKQICIFGMSFFAIYIFTSWIYNLLNPNINGISASSEILARISPDVIIYWIQGGLRYFVILLLITGFFPGLLPFLIYKRLDRTSQRFTVFIAMVLAFAIVESVGMIYVNENMERIHIRYLAYTIPVIMLFFIKALHSLQEQNRALGILQKTVIIGCSLAGIVMMIVLDCFCVQGSSIDGNSNRFLVRNDVILSQLFDMSLYEIVIKIVLCLFILFNMILLLKGQYKKFAIVIISFFCIAQVTDNYLCYAQEIQLKRSYSLALEEDAMLINEYIDTCIEENEKIALVTADNTGDAIELHIERYPVYNISYEQCIRDIQTDDGTLPDNLINYYGFGTSEKGQLPDYIIIRKELQRKYRILSYEKVEETPAFEILRKAKDIFELDIPTFESDIKGVTEDGWITSEKVNITIEAKQKVNTIIFQFHYLDGAKLGIMDINGEEKIYDLAECGGKVEYSVDIDNMGTIQLRLYGVRTVEPGEITNGVKDNRELCAQVLGIWIITEE